MKILKNIGIGLGVIIALFFIVALFIDGEYHVERNIVINKPSNEVFEYVKYLRNQDNYSVWAKLDDDMKKEFRGTDATVGFVSAWDSEKNDVGAGEQEITKIMEGKRIEYQIRFLRPFEATDFIYMNTESLANGQCKVIWGFDGKMDYPMNMMLLFMDMDEMLGESLQTGLNNLKGVLEQ